MVISKLLVKRKVECIMNDEIIVRKAEMRDVDALAELLGALFTIETDFAVDAQRQRAGLLFVLEQPAQCCIIVAECDFQIVGMCTGQLLVSTAEGGLKILVEDLVVAEEQRCRGIGTMLIDEVKKWADAFGVKRMDLLADQRNHLALDFYLRRKWQKTQLIALQKRL